MRSSRLRLQRGNSEIAKVWAKKQKADYDLINSMKHAEETHANRMLVAQRSQRDREVIAEQKYAEASKELAAITPSLQMAEIDLRARASERDALQIELVRTRALIGTSDANLHIQNALIADRDRARDEVVGLSNQLHRMTEDRDNLKRSAIKQHEDYVAREAAWASNCVKLWHPKRC